MVLHMHRVHPGGAGAAELAGGPASVVKLVREPMGGAPGWGSCDWRTAGVAEGAFVGRREGQVRVCGDGWTVALQDPEVPAGGAKPEVHSPSASIKVRWDWDCNWNWSSESARPVAAQDAARVADRLRVLGSMQGRRPGSTITGRRDLPGRAQQIAGAIAGR